MIKQLILASLLFIASAVASAQDFGNPIAFLQNDKGGTLVLTDKEGKPCPVGSYLAVAVNTPSADPIFGCWIVLQEEGQEPTVVLAWLPDYNIQKLPARLFRSVPQDNRDTSVRNL